MTRILNNDTNNHNNIIIIYTRLRAPPTAQGFSLIQIVHKLDYLEYNTKHAHFTNVNINKHNPKASPFGTALVQNG